MRSFILAAVAALAIGVNAAPSVKSNEGLLAAREAQSELLPRDDCLTESRAQQVATNFKNLIANYTDSLANQTLTPDFTDYSDSVNTLIDGGCSGPVPLGSATFTSRATFEKGQGGQPAIPFQQLNVWHNCDHVFLRWYSAQTPERVTGIIVMHTQPASAKSKYKDLIKRVYSEFNSGAWLVNLNVFKPTCSS